MPVLKFKDYEVYYDVKGSGKPILFLNGIMMSTASWNTFSNTVCHQNTFVRVDFYEINGHVYFGELTFYPGSGVEEFEPELYDYELGSWLTLPTKK